MTRHINPWFEAACTMNPWMIYWGAMAKAWCPARSQQGHEEVSEAAAENEPDLPRAHMGDGPALPV
ncbi:hypothetical protein ACX9MO_13245 [Pseudooceanicola sp. 502str34]|uniref:hypothetical protein n=1 Tax=Maritimibacter alkaliphilus TaxID=404236 RepID=UPI001C98A9FA|nr:hypothetical protein [Maritimibacter alkaliphilus]MBY6088898.1 hypothetical protein [Maritimibacter alkaliphilus]